ncbi:MAG: nucleotidyltransferase domain-containing protein [Leptolyngbya sp. SIO4C1]|nr:nucleotidyltransferase domain-containing protein [Leptolyngbya sp. SIO4C1]
MARTIRQLTAEERQQFDPTRNLANVLSTERWKRARARLSALVLTLRKEFGAKRIVLFGSLTQKEAFTRWSDIDLAAWGIAPERFYEAVVRLNDLSPEIKVDLVDPERCQSAALNQIIQEEGKEV